MKILETKFIFLGFEVKSACVCVLLLSAWQLGSLPCSYGAEPKSQSSESDGNTIFAAIVKKYRNTERLRIHGRLKVSYLVASRVTQEQFEIFFSRDKEIHVKVGDFQTTSPAIIGFEKSFRLKEGEAYEYYFGVETKRYESGQKEFLKRNLLRYRFLPATLPSLLLLDESMFFSDHLQPKDWKIEDIGDLPKGVVMLKLHWVKGDTFIKVRLRDQKLLECKFQFHLADLKTASFEFDEGEIKWVRGNQMGQERSKGTKKSKGSGLFDESDGRANDDQRD